VFSTDDGQSGDHLFVNDKKADVSDFDFLAKAFLTLLKSVGLNSLSFLKDVSMRELRAFVGALGQLPQTGVDVGHWRRTAKEKGFRPSFSIRGYLRQGFRFRGGRRPHPYWPGEKDRAGHRQDSRRGAGSFR